MVEYRRSPIKQCAAVYRNHYDVVVQRRGSGEVLVIPKAAIAYCAPGRESAER